MSTKSKRNLKWNKLLSAPFPFRSQPFLVNNDEFMIVPSNTFDCNADGIYTFNTQKNEWTKIVDYDKNFKCNVYSAAYDKKNKLLYIYDTSTWLATILIFDLQTRNKVTSTTQLYVGYYGLIFADDKLHKICSSDGDHYIHDKAKEFQKITTFASLKSLFHYGTIYLKLQKTMLLFGGEYYLEYKKNSIYGFSFIDSKWKELNIKMPITLSNFGLVSTKNEQYIIILGGATTGDEFSDNIFIYDITNNIFTKSKLKCPKKGPYSAVIINNSKRDEITSFGFVNDCYKRGKFIKVRILPHDLIQIICCYFCYEEIYLLNQTTSEHWKINVDYILQS